MQYRLCTNNRKINEVHEKKTTKNSDMKDLASCAAIFIPI